MYFIAYITTHDQCLIVAVHIRVLTKGGRGLPEIGQYMCGIELFIRQIIYYQKIKSVRNYFFI